MSPSELSRILRFVIVGASSTLLYFALLWALKGAIASTPVLTAICYMLSMAYNYLVQSWFTFQFKAHTRKSVSRYFVMQASAMVVNSGVMTLLVDGIGMSLFVAQVFVTGCVAIMVFLTSKHWVYRVT